MAAGWEGLAMQAARAYGGPKSEAGQWAMGLVRLLMTRGAPLPLAGPVLSPSSRHGGGVGLCALRDLEAGEEVLRVPPALWVPHSSDAALRNAEASAPALLERLAVLDEAMHAQQHRLMTRSRVDDQQPPPPLLPSVAPLAALATQVLFRGAAGEDAAYLHWLHAALPLQDFVAAKSPSSSSSSSSPLASASSSFPAFWPEERLRELQGALGSRVASGDVGLEGSLQQQQQQQQQQLRNPSKLPSLARAIHRALFTHNQGESSSSSSSMPSPAHVLWALTLVQSRATNSSASASPVDNASSSSSSSDPFPFTLVPYFDLLNHASRTEEAAAMARERAGSTSTSTTSTSTRGGGSEERFVNCVQSFDASAMCFRVTALTRVAAGEECFINYGDLPNRRLLPLYGFCLADNPYDALPLALPNLTDLPAPPTPASPSAAGGGGGGAAAAAAAAGDTGTGTGTGAGEGGGGGGGGGASDEVASGEWAGGGMDAAVVLEASVGGVTLRPEDLVTTRDAPLPRQLVAFAEAAFRGEGDGGGGDPESSGSGESEGGGGDGESRQRGLRWLSEGLRQQAAAYGTSLEEDTRQLAAAEREERSGGTGGAANDSATAAAGWKRQCLVARIGEKRLLQGAIGAAEAEAAALLKEQQQKQQLRPQQK